MNDFFEILHHFWPPGKKFGGFGAKMYPLPQEGQGSFAIVSQSSGTAAVAAPGLHCVHRLVGLAAAVLSTKKDRLPEAGQGSCQTLQPHATSHSPDADRERMHCMAASMHVLYKYGCRDTSAACVGVPTPPNPSPQPAVGSPRAIWVIVVEQGKLHPL